LKGHGFSHAVRTRQTSGFTPCGKTQGFDFALKGRGFSRAVHEANERRLYPPREYWRMSLNSMEIPSP
jgi:hypothetical protein